MTYQHGVDYSFSRPSLTALKANDVSFVCRYLSYNPDKSINSAELAALHNANLGVVFNWENSANDMAGGASNGRTYALAAQRQLNALGVHSDIPVYFSCDTDITSSAQMGNVTAFLTAAANVLGSHRVGVYGQYAVIERVVGTSYCTWGWQTLAWSNGKVSSKAHIYQYHNGALIGGGNVDLDRALKLPYGAYTNQLPDAEYDMMKLDGLALPELKYGADDSKVGGYHYVHRLQILLNFEQTGPDLTVDGIYGSKTADVVAHLYGGDGKTVSTRAWTDLYGLVMQK